LNVARPQNKYG